MLKYSKITVCLDFIFLPLQLSFEQKPHVCPPMNWKPKRAELLLVNRSRFSLIKNWGNVFISKKGEGQAYQHKRRPGETNL